MIAAGSFELFETENFSAVALTLDAREQLWLVHIKSQLKANPFAGKPLGHRWFREKKFENKRLYYLVSERKQRILLLAFGNKKEQSKLIAHIRLNEKKYWAILNAL